MKKARFAESKIVGIVKEADEGMKVGEFCHKPGISDATYYKWKSRYGAMETSDVERVRELEVENAKLKRMYADLAFENRAMKGLIAKEGLEPTEKREVTRYLVEQHQLIHRPVLPLCRAASVGLLPGTATLDSARCGDYRRYGFAGVRAAPVAGSGSAVSCYGARVGHGTASASTTFINQ